MPWIASSTNTNTEGSIIHGTSDAYTQIAQYRVLIFAYTVPAIFNFSLHAPLANLLNAVTRR
jgi:Na+(H+)/acetate symporter ActP